MIDTRMTSDERITVDSRKFVIIYAVYGCLR